VRARTLEEVSAVFDEHGVHWGPYRTFKELVRDDPRAASPVASPLVFSSCPEAPAPPAPEIGADTEGVLADLLGLRPAEIAELRSSGVID
jgi:2-methylfumaryl-CoA isomerase